jgi:hypothetical protein
VALKFERSGIVCIHFISNEKQPHCKKSKINKKDFKESKKKILKERKKIQFYLSTKHDGE